MSGPRHLNFLFFVPPARIPCHRPRRAGPEALLRLVIAELGGVHGEGSGFLCDVSFGAGGNAEGQNVYQAFEKDKADNLRWLEEEGKVKVRAVLNLKIGRSIYV